MFVKFINFQRQTNLKMPGICPRCEKNVYFAEEVKGLGNVYHRLCFTCNHCRKMLDSGSITEHDNQMFCNSCYRSVRNTAPINLLMNFNRLFTGKILGRKAMDLVEELERCPWMMVMDTRPTRMRLTTKPKHMLLPKSPSCQTIHPT